MAEERHLRTQEVIPWKDAALLSAMLLLSALISLPSAAFLPRRGFTFWCGGCETQREPIFPAAAARGRAAVLVILLQFLFYFGGIVETQGGMVVLFSGEKNVGRAALVVLTQLFPLFAQAAFWDRETLKKPLFTLTLLLDAVAIAQMLVLSETGYRAQDGNFGWAVMGAALMLWAVVLPFFAFKASAWVRRLRVAADGAPHVVNRPRAEAAKIIIGGVMLLWHLGSGIGYLWCICSFTKQRAVNGVAFSQNIRNTIIRTVTIRQIVYLLVRHYLL
jgi:hypothetical protein